MNALSIHRKTQDILFLLFIHILHVCCIDVKPQKEHFTPDYNIYHNLSSIEVTLDNLLKENRNLAKLLGPAKYVSMQGRKQYVIQVKNFATTDLEKSDRLKVLFSFGEHAREFLPIESLLYFLKRVFKSWHSSETPDIDLSKVEIYVVAIANPDGRQHVETTKNYCWRGTSTGVDINRNFDWEFGGKGSSNNPADEEYRGPKPFSEKESLVYQDLTRKVQFDGFLSLHSGIKQIYIPFADSVSQDAGRKPVNVNEMRRLAHILSNTTVFKYQYGQAMNLNDYSADGTIFDYMAGKRKVPFSYAIELWGPDKHKGPSCFDLFNPPNEKMQIVISNLYPLYVKFINYLLDWKTRSLKRDVGEKFADVEEQVYDFLKNDKREHTEPNGSSSFSPRLFLLCLVIICIPLVILYSRYHICRRMYQRRRIISLRALSSTLSLNLFSV